MTTIRIKSSDIWGFDTPRANEGQIVTVSYGATEDFILVDTHDAAARKGSVEAYRWPDGMSRDLDTPFEVVPRLGEYVGPVEVIDGE